MRLLHGSRYSYVKLELVHTEQVQVEQGKVLYEKERAQVVVQDADV